MAAGQSVSFISHIPFSESMPQADKAAAYTIPTWPRSQTALNQFAKVVRPSSMGASNLQRLFDCM
eukprot:scaffold162857_cov33-Tisochrysis_lutea.AAC.3